MFNSFNNLPELLDYFKDQETCLAYWEQIRWEGEVRCLHCQSEKIYRTNRGFKCAEKECGKKFSSLVGSIFENTKLPLSIWFAAIFLATTSKKGVSSLQLSRQFGIGAKAAWYMLHRIREGYTAATPEALEGVVMADETFVGGKNKNRHWDKKVANSQGRAFIDKTPVLGIMEEGGKVKCFVVSDTKASTIQPILLQNVKAGSKLYSDEWPAYRGLGRVYEHHVVDHGRKQYKNGDASTNAIEGFWSQLKKGLIGMYQSVSRKHLQRYCDEFVFRMNHRLLKVSERFETAMRCCSTQRILYRELTT